MDVTTAQGVEVIVLGDQDFREMFPGPEEADIEHCMSRVSLLDHDYHQQVRRQSEPKYQLNFTIYSMSMYCFRVLKEQMKIHL